MALLSQALHLGYLLSPHRAFQGHAAHTARWPTMLSPNGSSDTCISDGVFHIPMPCFHGAPPDLPTGRASPNTAPGVCDTPPPQAHGMLGVVAHPVPTPGEGTNGNRARRDRGERRTPYRPPPGSCRPSPGGHTIGASPPPSGCLVWGSCWDQRR